MKLNLNSLWHNRPVKAHYNLDSVENKESTIPEMNTETAFTDQSIEYKPYSPEGRGFSLGDIAGREVISANRAGFTCDNYECSSIAQTVAEGEEANDRRINVNTIITDSKDSIIFEDIITVGEDQYEDDPDLRDIVANNHVEAFINAENKKATEILTSAKEAVPVASGSIESAINTYLCGKAKRNTVILVNSSGFAMIDRDIDGVPMVSKSPEGNFIYKNKYEICEVSDDILPNDENDVPITIIGDLFSILKFFIIREEGFSRENLVDFTISDREVKKEVIALSTKSDKAFIIGSLAE